MTQRRPAAATTGEVWKRFQCIGGPFDGLIVSLWKRARNVILSGPDGRPYEYLDMAVDDLSPILAAAHIVGTEEGHCKAKLEYSGWLTPQELRLAKKLAGS